MFRTNVQNGPLLSPGKSTLKWFVLFGVSCDWGERPTGVVGECRGRWHDPRIQLQRTSPEKDSIARTDLEKDESQTTLLE